MTVALAPAPAANVVVMSPRLAHLDLTEATRFDRSTIDELNAAFTRATAAGYRFRVTPPLALEPRQAFHRAAIHRQLLWA